MTMQVNAVNVNWW